VNPNRDEVLGEKCYRNLSELPEVVDCVLIATPRELAVQNLEEAGRLGIPAAIVFASGFGEEFSPEGQHYEAEVVRIAGQYGMEVMGPNCIGCLNNVDKVALWGMLGADFDFETRKPGIALIAQSGGVCTFITAKQQLDISFSISSGNGSVTSIDDFIDYCVDHDSVNVVSVYLEGVKKPEVFTNALRKAAAKKKPVVILKAGRSALGTIAAASHTASMAGSERAFEAVFKRYGVVLVDSFEELVATTQAMNVLAGNFPKGNGFAMLNGSGGENTVAADLAAKYDVNLPPLTDEVKEKINAYLPSFGNPMNPLDYTSSVQAPQQICGLMECMAEVPGVNGIIMGSQALEETNERIEQQQKMFGHDSYAQQVDPLLLYRKLPGSLPVFLLPAYEDRRSLKHRRIVEENGVALLACSEIGWKIMQNIGRRAEYDFSWRTPEMAVPARSAKPRKGAACSEAESKALVAQYGIPVPKQANVTSEAELNTALAGLSFPLVMKINSPDILHKSDIGGVVLDIRDAQQAGKAMQTILQNAKTYAPAAKIDGVLVQEMAQSGVEIIVGIANDDVFGPMLLAGLGGIATELYKDTALSPCPVNHAEAVEMLKSLSAWPLLEGFRGSAACDVDALAEVMVQVSRMAAEKKDEWKELDLNPVIVYEKGAGVLAVDAAVVKYQDE
ncbi:acetate--CoA ligase family protein, partial [Ruminococcaceae bacterium OttesenSCG-928-O06]|nr:acetate--CoA ligase family protein [Ruminococcaceae bacterium OttesenSCG-928-O06]